MTGVVEGPRATLNGVTAETLAPANPVAEGETFFEVVGAYVCVQHPDGRFDTSPFQLPGTAALWERGRNVEDARFLRLSTGNWLGVWAGDLRAGAQGVLIAEYRIREHLHFSGLAMQPLPGDLDPRERVLRWLKQGGNLDGISPHFGDLGALRFADAQVEAAIALEGEGVPLAYSFAHARVGNLDIERVRQNWAAGMPVEYVAAMFDGGAA